MTGDNRWLARDRGYPVVRAVQRRIWRSKSGGSTLAVRRAVDCRIEVEQEQGQRLVRLAGRLAEAQVPDLLDVCGDNSVVVRLHLGDLISVDAVGLETIHRLRERGVSLTDVPAYIQLKLDGLRPTRARAR